MRAKDRINVGCASNIIHVPLFTELYGYGPFLGRRNRGVLDNLHCRCASFKDGDARVIIISNDLVTMDPERAWVIRREVASQTGTPPENIMVCGSHTHSGPTISRGIGWGELDLEFAADWVKTAIVTAVTAVRDEKPATMRCGIAPLSEKIGYNRIWEDGPTDPEIRWAGFYADDGGLKLLMHNHGMHGVVFGSKMLLVSADWPGASNQALLDRKIAENVLFLQGAAGDINAKKPCCLQLEDGKKAMAEIAGVYVNSLTAGLDAGAPADAVPVRSMFKKEALPSEPVTPQYLREMAPRVRENGSGYQADRMEEMALYMEAGGKVTIDTDLQVLRIGALLVYAMGGEPFCEVGRAILDANPTEFGMVASIANDNLRYIPTPKAFAEHPDIITQKKGFGYYETQFVGFGRFRAKYRADVAPFLVERYTAMAREM